MCVLTAKIIIASTLKPVWDPRAYEKLGKSLAGPGQYNVEIIGSGRSEEVDKNIKIHSLKISRNPFIRLFRQIDILRIFLKSQPDLLIISTHELIIPAIVYHLTSGKKIIYDIRENYNFNLRHQNIYPIVLRQLMAGYIRVKENTFQSFFSGFILAENCYLEEIGFLNRNPHRCLVLENKCARLYPQHPPKNKDKIQLLFSGTISEIYGVIEATEFYKNLPPDKFELTIIGHCPNRQLRNQLSQLARSIAGINLRLSKSPVAHKEIVATFTNRTIGLLPYRKNKSIDNKVPTKLFEYMANSIPVLISPNKKWETIVENHNGGMIIDFSAPIQKDHISAFFNLINNSNIIDLELLMWKSQESKFLTRIKKLLAN